MQDVELRGYRVQQRAELLRLEVVVFDPALLRQVLDVGRARLRKTQNFERRIVLLALPADAVDRDPASVAVEREEEESSDLDAIVERRSRPLRDDSRVAALAGNESARLLQGGLYRRALRPAQILRCAGRKIGGFGQCRADQLIDLLGSTCSGVGQRTSSAVSDFCKPNQP